MHVLIAALVGATLFPLAPGTHWTFREFDSRAVSAMSVRAGGVLQGFPGAGNVRVRQVAKTVQAWDRGDGRWEDWFRFGAPTKATYSVALSSTQLWRKVEMRVASKTVTERDHNGKRYRGCTRFELQSAGVADATLWETTFCPRVGLVRYLETTIAGPRNFELASFK